MNISIGNDHAGTDYKFRIIEFIKSKNIEPLISPSASWFTIDAMQKVVRPNKEKNWEEFSTSQRIALRLCSYLWFAAHPTGSSAGLFERRRRLAGHLRVFRDFAI